MKTQAGQTYRREWQKLASYLYDTWPEVRQGSTVETALWLLTYLRRIEDSGLLPAITDDGTLLRRVRDEWAVQQMVRKEREQEECA